MGQVFAVETYCPATDGISAARIEEEVVLTPDGAKIITLFPAEELPIARIRARAFVRGRRAQHVGPEVDRRHVDVELAHVSLGELVDAHVADQVDEHESDESCTITASP